MSTATSSKTSIPNELDARVLARIIDEGYGPGAWHGADLRAAIADVSPELAFKRPERGRHNIAEIALHHAFCARSVSKQLSGTPPQPFVLEGDDWFELSDETTLSWEKVRATLSAEQQRLARVVAESGEKGGGTGSKTLAERFDLVLGITCHAVYHAGQIQLIKRLAEK